MIPPILLIVSTAVSVLAFTLGYNAETGYLINSPTSVALYIVIAAGIIVSACCALSIKKDVFIKINERIHLPTSFFAHLIAVICALIASGAVSESKYTIGASAISVMKAIFFVSALISLLFHPALWTKSKNKDAFVLISNYASVLLCLSAIAILYFDVSVEMNNPQKILIQLSMVSVCLSELAESRSKIYQNGVKLQIFAKHVALIFSPAAVTAALVARFSGTKIFSNFYLFSAIIVAIYAVFSVIALVFSKIEPKSDESTSADGEV